MAKSSSNLDSPTSQQAIPSLSPLSPVQIEIEVPDEDINHVEVGFDVKIWIDGQEDEPLIGTVTKVHQRSETRNANNVFIPQVGLNVVVFACSAVIAWYYSLVIPFWTVLALMFFGLSPGLSTKLPYLMLLTPVLLNVAFLIFAWQQYFSKKSCQRVCLIAGVATGAFAALVFVLLGGSGAIFI